MIPSPNESPCLKIDVFDYRGANVSPLPSCTFSLPMQMPTTTCKFYPVTWYSASPSWPACKDPAIPFYPIQDEMILKIPFSASNKEGPGDFTLILPTSTIRKYIPRDLNTHLPNIPWEEWGPHGSRFITEPVGISSTFGMRLAAPVYLNRGNHSTSVVDAVRIYDFNQAAVPIRTPPPVVFRAIKQRSTPKGRLTKLKFKPAAQDTFEPTLTSKRKKGKSSKSKSCDQSVPPVPALDPNSPAVPESSDKGKSREGEIINFTSQDLLTPRISTPPPPSSTSKTRMRVAYESTVIPKGDLFENDIITQLPYRVASIPLKQPAAFVDIQLGEDTLLLCTVSVVFRNIDKILIGIRILLVLYYRSKKMKLETLFGQYISHFNNQLVLRPKFSGKISFHSSHPFLLHNIRNTNKGLDVIFVSQRAAKIAFLVVYEHRSNLKGRVSLIRAFDIRDLDFDDEVFVCYSWRSKSLRVRVILHRRASLDSSESCCGHGRCVLKVERFYRNSVLRRKGTACLLVRFPILAYVKSQMRTK